MKSEYIGLAFFTIYIANISSTASNALISISAAVLLLYTIYDYKHNKRKFPLPGAEFQVPWWLFFGALLLDSLFLSDYESMTKAVEYVYLSLPCWLLLAFYYYHFQVKYFIGGIAAALIYVGVYSLYVFIFVNHMATRRVVTFAANLNGLGTLMAMSLPFVFLMVKYYYREHRLGTAILLSSGCLGLMALIFTGSRGAMMGFTVGCLVLLVVKVLVFGVRKEAKQIFCGMLICCLVLGGFQGIFGKFHRGYDNQRQLFIESSIAMWRDHPVLGVGLTKWETAYYNQYKLPQAFEKTIDMPHNTIALFFSTTGLVGGMSFLIFSFGIFLCLCKYMRRQPDNYLVQAMLWSFVAVSVHGMVDAGLSMRTALRLCSGYMGVTVASVLYYERAKLAAVKPERQELQPEDYSKQRFYGLSLGHKPGRQDFR